MQICQSLVINRGFFRKTLCVTAFELTIGQIIGIYYACKDFSFPDDGEKFSRFMHGHIFSRANLVLCNIPLEKLSPVEKQYIETFFYRVNAALFNPQENKEALRPRIFKGNEVYRDFVRLVFHNPEFKDLPFSVVKTISDNASKWNKDHG